MHVNVLLVLVDFTHISSHSFSRGLVEPRDYPGENYTIFDEYGLISQIHAEVDFETHR